jgi:hypothetical protein
MIEHLFPYSSLIGGWYIPEKICDDIINYYHKNATMHKDGKSYDSVLDKDIVDDRRLCLEPKQVTRDLLEYNNTLAKVLVKYKKKYPFMDAVQPYKITQAINIQHSKKGGGYKIDHIENDGRLGVVGRRHIVFMTYLNTLTNGGTIFKYQELITPAIKGLTLIWPAYATHPHRGQISFDEEKYVITGWLNFYE